MSKFFQRLTDAFLALVGALLLTAHAPAAAQLAITYDTKCGAPGVGKHNRTGELVQLDAAGAVGLKVDKISGFWRACTPDDVKVEAKPADCNVPAPLRWEANGLLCQSNGGGTVAHGKLSQAIQAQAGPVTGVIVLSCVNGQLSTRLATCDQTQYCYGGYKTSEDGGDTFWTWDGTLRNGERGTATHPSGKTRPVECSGGKLRLI